MMNLTAPMQKTFYATTIAATMLISSNFSPLKAEEIQKPGIIEVQSSGKSLVIPDTAIISVGVMREAKTAQQALQENTKAMKAVLTALKAEGIDDRDLQTSNFSIYPKYGQKISSQTKQQVVTGYAVNNGLTIRIKDVAKVGAILDKIVTLGVNSNGNIQFTNSNPEQAIEEARKNAVENAIKKAGILAQSAGVTLGRITLIKETSHSNQRPRALARAVQFDAAKSSPVPVAAGENSYSVSVSMGWEISQ